MAVLQDININVHGQPSEKRLQTFLRLSQNENGRMINFRVLGPPLPSGCTATFSGTKPDGNVYSKTGTVAGNFVIIQEDMQMTAVAGVWDAKLDIINGSHNIMTALIRVVVDADVVDPDAIASDSQLQGLVAEAKYYAEHARTDAYGSPLTAPTKAQMTDNTRVYVYTGSETGMTAGNWYYWNGSTWTSGGVYNAVAVQTDTTLSVAGKAADGKATGDALNELKEDLNAEYVGYKGTLTSADDLFALAYGVYFIPAVAGDKPSNLPSDFVSNHNGYAIILGVINGSTSSALAIDLYAKRVWLYTGYGWTEIPNTTRTNALISAAINSSLGELEDSNIITNAFAANFIAWGWNGNTTRGFHADSTRLSIISPQYCPYDIVLSNLSSIFSVCTIRIFTGTSTVPDNLVSTTQYNVNKGISGYVDSIILPKNTYWTIELSKPNNVVVDTDTDPDYLHFAISTTIVGDTLRASRTLLVGKTGAPYTTIQSACDDAINGDTILILPGTYVEQVSIWGKCLHLIGLDRESTIIKDTSGLYSTPTLEMNIGSLKNLTLIETGDDNPWGADEGRSYAYTMHIESGEGYTGIGELWVDNCKFINNKHAAIGCGLYQDLHVHFNNCYMYSGRASDLPDNYYRGTFYFHTNRQDNVTGQRMTVKDCEIINESTKVFYGGVVSPGAQTGNVRSTFINNNFYAMEAENNNSNDVIISSSILDYHDCKLAVNSRGNNIPALNSV